MKLHKEITKDRILEAVEADDNLGICTACGADADCVEPDARSYVCETCGEPAVFGAEELLIMALE